MPGTGFQEQQNAGKTILASGTLKRKCACGQHSKSGGECHECQSKSNQATFAHANAVAHRSASTTAPRTVPPLVHEVLGSTGRPLDQTTRTFMESRFEHDFSQVQIHTDNKAANSATAVDAVAYTVGRDIVFNAGQYQPQTYEGRRLLAHELTHVVQQGVAPASGGLSLSQPGDREEIEADSMARTVMETPDSAPSEAANTSSIASSRAARLPRQILPQAQGQHMVVARQKLARAPGRTTIQCINNALSSAGIPWAIITLVGVACGLIGLLGGPAAPGTVPAAAAVCIAGFSGLSVGFVLGVIVDCIADPNKEWIFAANEGGGGAGAGGETAAA